MSESKHTPGPWMVTGTTVYALMLDGWCNGKEVRCNRFYAHVYTDRRTSEGEAEANARLIAAAPEMLEALQGLLADEDADFIRSHLWDAARAAVAKATAT